LGLRHAAQHGLYAWRNYPYLNEKQTACRKSSVRARKAIPNFAIESVIEVDCKGDEECMKKIVCKVGAVAVAVHANEIFMSYAEGRYDNKTCPKNDPNHAMVYFS
jgi:hypothetical protein